VAGLHLRGCGWPRLEGAGAPRVAQRAGGQVGSSAPGAGDAALFGAAGASIADSAERGRSAGSGPKLIGVNILRAARRGPRELQYAPAGGAVRVKARDKTLPPPAHLAWTRQNTGTLKVLLETLRADERPLRAAGALKDAIIASPEDADTVEEGGNGQLAANGPWRRACRPRARRSSSCGGIGARQRDRPTARVPAPPSPRLYCPGPGHQFRD
jgi:hypothetical protein